MFYFLLKPYVGPTQANYQHACIVFAEGLTALNIPYSANIDYFPSESGCFLFKKQDQDHTYVVTAHPEDFKEELQAVKKQVIIFDSKDEWARQQSTNLLHLANHYFMTTCKVETNRIKPLCFALSNRMIDVISKSQEPWWSRSDEIFYAHRVNNHRLRNLVKDFYDRTKPEIKYHTHLDNFQQPETDIHNWMHTGRRHNPEYFAELQKYKYMDAHGGYDTRDGSIIQWDSWKVWEGFLAGMLVITADLDYYNIKLPYKLEPYKHYVPIRYNNLKDSYNKLALLTDIQKSQIAKAGQTYVLENFCPQSMAKYILKRINYPTE